MTARFNEPHNDGQTLSDIRELLYILAQVTAAHTSQLKNFRQRRIQVPASPTEGAQHEA